MLEFAREQWLWLLLLLALFYAGWFFARRYRKRRVTYGAIWQRVARRVLPPAWKRLLRQALTLLVATVMLAAVALFAAGLQRSPDELPGPLLLIIVQDNSVSMRARHGDTTRRELANERARELLATLREDDRAILASFKFGQPLLGPWLGAGAEAELPPTDFAEPDMRALAQAVHALGHPPGVPERPAPRRIVVWLGDVAPELPGDIDLRLSGPAITGRAEGGIPVYLETFGRPAANDAIVAARYTPPQQDDEHGGVIEAQTLSGAQPRVQLGGTLIAGARVELPAGADATRVTISTAGGDALPEDDAVSLHTRAPAIRRVTLCYPAEDGEPNPLLLDLLRDRLPGREFAALAVPGAGHAEADLLVADRALPPSHGARAMLLFGVGGEAGVTGAPVNARLRAPLEASDVGLDVPDLSLIAAEHAIPLVQTSLTPLTRHIEGGDLVAIQRQPREILYCGFIPHRSTLLESQDGLLLLVRWLEAVQQLPPPLIPPLVAAGETITLQLPGPAEIRPARDTGWPDAWFEPGWSLTPGPDGRVQWQAPQQPGRWTLSTDRGASTNFQIVWSSERQRLPYSQTGPLPALHPEPQASWLDLLPALLLWIALGMVVLEWLLWLAGVLE